MLRPTVLAPLFLAATLSTTLTIAGCSDDTPPPADPTPPASITETFTDTLNVNGARTHPFAAQRAGSVIASLTSLAPDDTVTIGLSLGTWNGTSCQVVLANDNATLTSGTVVASASSTGSLCVRVYDVGK